MKCDKKSPSNSSYIIIKTSRKCLIKIKYSIYFSVADIVRRRKKTFLRMDDIERALLVKNEVFVYKIPPRTSAKGYRAADWKLDAPDWTGRLRCIEKGK